MLKFDLKLLPHPYIDEPGCDWEVWGMIALEHNGIVLSECEWDILVLLEWFLANGDAVKHDIFPFDEISVLGKSIAEKLHIQSCKLRDSDEENDTDYYDQLLAPYIQSHFFILRGSLLMRFYIGINEGRGEISDKEYLSGGEFSYAIDIDSFVNETIESCRRVIQEWRERYYTEPAWKKIVNLEKTYGVTLLR